MLRWTLWGTLGVLVAPLCLIALFAFGLDWRALFVVFACVALGLSVLLWRWGGDENAEDEGHLTLREAIGRVATSLRRPSFRRTLVLAYLGDAPSI